MKHATLSRLAIAGSMMAALVSAGCPSDDPPTEDGSSTGSADTGGSTAVGPSTSVDPTGAVDSTGGGTAGPVDPTGETPPTVDCGAGGTFEGSISISTDEDIAALDGIAIVTGDLVVTGTSYSNVDFLSCLTEIHGDIEIYDNAFLIDLSGTDNLTKVGRLPAPAPTVSNPGAWDDGKGSISITNNVALFEVNGFGSLVNIGEQGEDPSDCSGAPVSVECISQETLLIRNNTQATQVSGFGSLAFVFGSLVIQENDSLRNIDGFTSLQGIGAAFTVNNNPMLCISSVNTVGAALQFLGNPDQSTTSGNDDSC